MLLQASSLKAAPVILGFRPRRSSSTAGAWTSSEQVCTSFIHGYELCLGRTVLHAFQKAVQLQAAGLRRTAWQCMSGPKAFTLWWLCSCHSGCPALQCSGMRQCVQLVSGVSGVRARDSFCRTQLACSLPRMSCTAPAGATAGARQRYRAL